jgi:Mitochondrial carrier protein
MMRDSIYTACYLGVCPMLREFLEQHPSMEPYPTGTPLLVSGVAAGLTATVATQPADTIKTRMQV